MRNAPDGAQGAGIRMNGAFGTRMVGAAGIRMNGETRIRRHGAAGGMRCAVLSAKIRKQRIEIYREEPLLCL